MDVTFKGRAPVVAKFGKKEVLLYTVSHITWALKIQDITFKKWEEKGYVPRPLFLGRTVGLRKGKETKKREGRVRYYLYEEVEALADVYCKYMNKKGVMEEYFKPELEERWKFIRKSFKQKYLRGTEDSGKTVIEIDA